MQHTAAFTTLIGGLNPWQYCHWVTAADPSDTPCRKEQRQAPGRVRSLLRMQSLQGLLQSVASKP
jgi:hypothetical protein